MLKISTLIFFTLVLFEIQSTAWALDRQEVRALFKMNDGKGAVVVVGEYNARQKEWRDSIFWTKDATSEKVVLHPLALYEGVGTENQRASNKLRYVESNKATTFAGAVYVDAGETTVEVSGQVSTRSILGFTTHNGKMEITCLGVTQCLTSDRDEAKQLTKKLTSGSVINEVIPYELVPKHHNIEYRRKAFATDVAGQTLLIVNEAIIGGEQHVRVQTYDLTANNGPTLVPDYSSLQEMTGHGQFTRSEIRASLNNGMWYLELGMLGNALTNNTTGERYILEPIWNASDTRIPKEFKDSFTRQLLVDHEIHPCSMLVRMSGQ